MKSQEVAVYREIQKNTEIAIKAIDTISDKVYDDQLAMQISKQAIAYSDLHNQALEKLIEAKAEPYHSNYISDMMLKGGIHYNTMLNTSTGHIAELMIKGSNSGIVEMNKILNRNENADENTLDLAKKLISYEETNIDTLKKYL